MTAKRVCPKCPQVAGIHTSSATWRRRRGKTSDGHRGLLATPRQVRQPDAGCATPSWVRLQLHAPGSATPSTRLSLSSNATTAKPLSASVIPRVDRDPEVVALALDRVHLAVSLRRTLRRQLAGKRSGLLHVVEVAECQPQRQLSGESRAFVLSYSRAVWTVSPKVIRIGVPPDALSPESRGRGRATGDG